MAFQGTLETFNLADVFQNLAQNHQTGTLHLNRDDGEERHLYFEDGKLLYLSKGKGIGLLRVGMYVARGVCDPSELQQAQQMAANSTRSIGQCLVSLGVTTPEKIGEIARFYIEEETYDLFLWSNATFEFVETPPEEGLFNDVRDANSEPIEIANLIMEAARRIDEWERLSQHVSSMQEVLVFDETLKEAARRGEFELTQSEMIVMATMNAGRDLDDIVRTTCLSPFEVATAAAGFVQAGMARPATVDELKDAVRETELVHDIPRCIKLYERILSLNSEDNAIRRKLAEILPEAERVDDALVHYGVLGTAAFQVHNDTEAIEIYNRIIELDPGNIIAHTRLIDLMNRTQQEEKAGEYAFKLSAILTEQDRIEEAIQACEKAVETDIRNIEYRAELVNLLLKINEKSRAAKELEMIGDILHKQGKNRAAADTYKRAMTMDRNLSHLKGKLQNVLLSEDEKRRRKTRVILIVTAIVVTITLAVAGASYYITEQNKLRKEWEALQNKQNKLPINWGDAGSNEKPVPLRKRADDLKKKISAISYKISQTPTRVTIRNIQSEDIEPEKLIKQESQKIVSLWDEIKQEKDALADAIDTFNQKSEELEYDFVQLKKKADYNVLGIGSNIGEDIAREQEWFSDVRQDLEDKLAALDMQREHRITEHYYKPMMDLKGIGWDGLDSPFELQMYAMLVKNVSGNPIEVTDAEGILKRINEHLRKVRNDLKWLKESQSVEYWRELQKQLQSSKQQVIRAALEQMIDDNNKKLFFYDKYWSATKQKGVSIELAMVIHSDVPGGSVFLDDIAKGTVGDLYAGRGLLIQYNPEKHHELSWTYPMAKKVVIKSKHYIQGKRNGEALPLYTFGNTQVIAPAYEPAWTTTLNGTPVTPITLIDGIFYIGMRGGKVLCIDPQTSRIQEISLLPDNNRMEIRFPPTWDKEKRALYWPLTDNSTKSVLVKFLPERTPASLGKVVLTKQYESVYGKFVVPMGFGSSRFIPHGRIGLMVTDKNVATIYLEHNDDPMKIGDYTSIGFKASQAPVIVKYVPGNLMRPLDYMVTPASDGKLYLHNISGMKSKGSLTVSSMNKIITPLLPVQLMGRTDPVYLFGVGGNSNTIHMADFLVPNDNKKVIEQRVLKVNGNLLPYVYQKDNEFFFCTTANIYDVEVSPSGVVNQKKVIDMSAKAVNGAPVVFNNTLYIGTDDGMVMAYSLRGRGEFRWKTNVPNNNPILGHPVIFDRKVYFLTINGVIYAYRISQ